MLAMDCAAVTQSERSSVVSESSKRMIGRPRCTRFDTWQARGTWQAQGAWQAQGTWQAIGTWHLAGQDQRTMATGKKMLPGFNK